MLRSDNSFSAIRDYIESMAMREIHEGIVRVSNGINAEIDMEGPGSRVTARVAYGVDCRVGARAILVRTPITRQWVVLGCVPT